MSDNKTHVAVDQANSILREAQTGNIDIVKQFKERHPDLHWSELRYEKTGDTILHVAARLGFLDIADFLLSNYAPSAVDCPNRDGKTALHEAAQFAQLDVLKLLLKRGAAVNALKRADWTPLMLACTKISRGSLNDNDFKCVEWLLLRGALVNCENKDGWTALHLICREGCATILYLLLDYGLDAFKRTRNGRTALHIASLHGHLSIVKVLLKLGLDVDAKDGCGNTALHEAALGGNLQVCKYLLSSHVNADLNAVNNSGFGVLHLAASEGKLDVIKYLVEEQKLNLNNPTKTNLTPLHCAARKKQVEAVNYLRSAGANEYFRDNFGRCAADYWNY